jgi:hypothetical protein
MGSIEVVYELRNSADYIISSATEVLSAGYPYQQITEQLFAGSVDYPKVADTFFQSYASLEGAMKSASISVVKTSELTDLADKFRRIMNDTAHLQYVNSYSIQQFSTNQNGLLFDFDSFTASVSADAELYAEFNKALSHVITYKDFTEYVADNLQLNTFSGISIYIPDALNIKYYDFYKNFDWYTDSRYDNYFGKFGFEY